MMCRPHSVLEVPDQRPARESSPGLMARVQWVQPMLGKLRSCSGLLGTLCSRMYCQTCCELQSAIGLTFTRPNLESHSILCAPVREVVWSRRMLVIHAL